MKPVIKAINSSCAKALSHRQFQQLLLDIQAEYGDVAYHNKMAQSEVCTEAPLPSKGGNWTIPKKGPTDARTIRSCLAG